MFKDSSRKSKSRKTRKPWTVAGFTINRPDDPAFALSPHASGKWQKNIRGDVWYFGNWARRVNGKLERIDGDGWEEAQKLYNAAISGNAVSEGNDRTTLGKLCDYFLHSQNLKVEAGELSPRSYYEYRKATELIITQFGNTRLVEELRPHDFETLRAKMNKMWGPVRLAKFIQLIRAVFNYAEKNRLITQSVAFGTGFEKPNKSVLRKHKNKSGPKLFTAGEIRELLDGRDEDGEKFAAASVQLRAMILLGINAGLGNTDIGNLQRTHLDLKNGWLNYPREKTGLPRRAPLWPETLEAIRAAIAERPEPKNKEDKDCIFLNRGRRRMVQSTPTSHSDYVSAAFGKRLRDLSINGRKGLNFYSLRHTFATIGLQTGDRDAVKAIMGHGSHDMLSVYDETGPSNERLAAVVDHVRTWLLGVR